MTYSSGDVALIGLIMTLGSVVQGAVGFASGLIGVPLLVLCGFDLLDATVINFVLTSVQNAAGAVQLWSHLEPQELVWPTVYRSLGLPLGIAALGVADGLNPDYVQQIVGLILLGSVLLLTAIHVQPRDSHHPLWIAIAFSASGFLTGFASVGGTPMVMYVNSLTWSAAKCRGFLFFCSAVLIPLMATLLAWKFGHAAIQPAVQALIVMPPTILGLWIGLKLGHRLDKERFRRLTYTLLVLIAMSAILSPLLASITMSQRS
jgi:uncharacterized membrane protein YfcA